MIHEVTLPKERIPAKYDYWSYKCAIQNGSKVSKGDKLATIVFSKDDVTKPRYLQHKIPICEFDMFSDFEGYVYQQHGSSTMCYNSWDSIKPNERILLTIYPDLDELCSSYFGTSYEISTDEFSSEKAIFWLRVAGKSFREGYMTKSGFLLYGGDISLQFVVLSGQPILKIISRKETLPIKKRDTVLFRFEDNSIRSFPIIETPGKMIAPYKDHCFVNLKLSKEDVYLFSNKGWDILKVEHNNGDAAHIFPNSYRDSYQSPFSSFLFKRYVKKYIQALGEVGVVLDDYSIPSERRSAESAPSEKEVCYVYLMKDISNGYYKIGISNRPEYRERTLQSEKPTIELLTAKPFTSRIIAEAIEQALHKAFGEKRLRGEWFELTPSDVNDIIQTLK